LKIADKIKKVGALPPTHDRPSKNNGKVFEKKARKNF
jgi:hypothetical protein